MKVSDLRCAWCGGSPEHCNCLPRPSRKQHWSEREYEGTRTNLPPLDEPAAPPTNPLQIYYMDNPDHRQQLKAIAKAGGQTVWVASTEGAEPVRLTNLRADSRGEVFGDASVVGCSQPTPLSTNPYRAHLVAVTNDLHRKLTGMRTGSSAYKYNYGRWLQASEDLVAFERMVGDV